MYALLAPDGRRRAPRVALHTLCSEIADGIERPAFVVDLSETGLRIQRPFVGGRTPREVQLEVELPGLDAIVWARGEPCFDWVRQVRGDLVRTTGIRFAAAAMADLRLIREVVLEARRAQNDELDLSLSSIYRRG